MRRFSRLWGFLLFLLLLLVLFRSIVVPFAFGTLVAYLLAPLVRRLAPRVGGRGFAVILIYLALFGFMTGFFGVLLPGVLADLSRLRDSAPEMIARLNDEWLPKATEWIDETFGSAFGAEPEAAPARSELIVQPLPDGTYRVDLGRAHFEVRENAGGWLIEADSKPSQQSFGDIVREIVASKGGELTEAAGTAVRVLITGIASFLTDFVLTFMLAAFILVDLDRVQGFIRSLVPPEHRPEFDELSIGVDQGMAGVIRGQLLICLVNGVLTYVGLLIFGIKYSLLLGVLAAVLSLIPIFGAILSSLPILLVALISNEADPEGGLAFNKALAMLAWILGIHLLEANYLNPKIIGTAAHIHPVIVVFALLAGEEMYGLTGALLAVPVASMIQTAFLFARKRSEAFNQRSGVLAIPREIRDFDAQLASRPIDLGHDRAQKRDGDDEHAS